MKKSLMVLILMVFSILLTNLVSASCAMGVSLINQDPYPATSGDYVKVVFQVTGLEDPSCGTASFDIVPQFPFSVDPGSNGTLKEIVSGTFAQGYQSTWILPYKLRVDSDALNGDNALKVKYAYNVDKSSPVYLTQDFNVDINNSETTFDLILSSYSYSTNALTLDLVNTGRSDALATTVEIPQQPGIRLIGSNKQVIGSLNANDDTTVNFGAAITGKNITAIITYNDISGVRRSVQKIISFSADAYANTKPNGSQLSTSFYLLIITWIAIVIFAVYRYYKNKKIKNTRR